MGAGIRVERRGLSDHHHSLILPYTHGQKLGHQRKSRLGNVQTSP